MKLDTQVEGWNKIWEKLDHCHAHKMPLVKYSNIIVSHRLSYKSEIYYGGSQ